MDLDDEAAFETADILRKTADNFAKGNKNWAPGQAQGKGGL